MKTIRTLLIALVIAAATVVIPSSLPMAPETAHAQTRAKYFQTLLNAVATDEAAVAIMLGAQTAEHTIYVTWSAGVTAGVVEIETAPSSDYAGTWAAMQTVNWVSESRVDRFSFTGAFGAVRTRISTAIANGTVTTLIAAN
jgi:hypothetical protein